MLVEDAPGAAQVVAVVAPEAAIVRVGHRGLFLHEHLGGQRRDLRVFFALVLQCFVEFLQLLGIAAAAPLWRAGTLGFRQGDDARKGGTGVAASGGRGGIVARLGELGFGGTFFLKK